MLVKHGLKDLLGRFESEIRAADHQQGHDQKRREGRQQKSRGKKDQDLVLEASPRDFGDDRKLALGRKADHVARSDRGIVDDNAGGLGARFACCRAHIVQ